MALVEHAPLRPTGRRTPRQKLAMAAQERARTERARRRLIVARTAGLVDGPQSLKVDAVREIQFTELGGYMPSRPTILGLAAMYAEGKTSLNDYLYPPRTGREPTVVAEPLQLVVDAAIEVTPGKNCRQIIKAVRKEAARRGLKLPGRHVVERIVREASAGVVGKASRLHGRRAGELDGLPHMTLPYTRTHDCWVQDEVIVPVYLGMWHREKRCFVSVLVYIALVIDYASRCIVGYHLCNPFRRDNEEGEPCTTGFDEKDVHASFISAAVKDCAPWATAEFAGALPQHIRMDGHPTHYAFRTRMRDEIAYKVTIIGGYRPYRNAVAERLNRTFKSLFGGMRGHVDDYLPTDRLKTDARDDRTQATATSQRITRKRYIKPEDLMRIEDFEADVLPQIIREYNEQHEHSALGGMTPRDAFHALSRPRNEVTGGDVLIQTMEATAVTVGRSSIVLERDGQAHRFSCLLGKAILLLGESITVRVHPLMACLFAPRPWMPGRYTRLRQLREAAALVHAATVGRQQQAAAAGFSETAASTQIVEMRIDLGDLAVDEAILRAQEVLSAAPVAGDPGPREVGDEKHPRGPAAPMSTDAPSAPRPWDIPRGFGANIRPPRDGDAT
jgi:hypothetical protein